MPCAVSCVGQPPAAPAKIALWAYHVVDPAGPLHKTQSGATLALYRDSLTHHWTTGLAQPNGDAAAQTRAILNRYTADLRDLGLSLAEHAVRTWLFVKDIDADYSDLVAARREVFTACDLTPDTHYIASTGIQGIGGTPGARVVMDAWAIAGLRPEQIRYLSAPDFLSPTHRYGVTFERGAALTYRDRRHVILSGTASINARGEIVHPGDVARQLDRTLANMSALLERAGATLDDMAHFIVYLRHPHDADVIGQILRERHPHIPTVIVTAPVCRPDWLVEIEGCAVVPADRPDLPTF